MNGFGYSTNNEGYNYTSEFAPLNQSTLTTGIRLGLHYSTRKWDLYGGLMVGMQINFRDGGAVTNRFFKGTAQNPLAEFIKTEVYSPFGGGQTTTDLFLSPYAGARYFVTKKVSLNLEVGQYTGNIGFGFKF